VVAIVISVNGVTGSIQSVCKAIGIVAYTTAMMRLKRGWSPEKAILTPAQEQNAVERGNKICSCCKTRKPVEDFYVLGRRSGTELQPYCKLCCGKKSKAEMAKIRETLIKHYSDGTMKCAICPEARFDALDIDHIHGGGRKERQGFGSNRKLYKHIIDTGFPPGYRVLCRNCNWIAFLRRNDPPSCP
jgi:hypothetical protein